MIESISLNFPEFLDKFLNFPEFYSNFSTSKIPDVTFKKKSEKFNKITPKF